MNSEQKEAENKRRFTLRLKGRKASLSLASFHAASLGESITPAIDKKLRKVKQRARLAKRRAKYRDDTRYYLCPGEYVSQVKSKANPKTYTCYASLWVDYRLVPALDAQGIIIRNEDGSPVLIKTGGHRFRVDDDNCLVLTATLGFAKLARMFKRWYARKGGATRFVFGYTINEDDSTLSLTLERCFDNDITHSTV